MKVCPIFHVSLLKPSKESNLLRRRQPPLPFIEIDNYEKYEVESILDSHHRYSKLEYLIHWHGYDINEHIWELTTNLVNALQKVYEFHQLYLDKPQFI